MNGHTLVWPIVHQTDWQTGFCQENDIAKDKGKPNENRHKGFYKTHSKINTIASERWKRKEQAQILEYI